LRFKGHVGFSILILPIFTYSLIEYSYMYEDYILNNPLENLNKENLIYSFIFYIIGERVPDQDLKLKIFMGNKPFYTYHRQFTHSLILWLSIFICSFYIDYSHSIYIMYFALGGLSHLLADMITGSIPIGLYGHYNKSFKRVGITKFFGKFLKDFASQKLPIFFDKISGLMFIIGLILIYFINLDKNLFNF